MSKKTILLEFNELSPTLMDQYIAAGHLPNFARLKRESMVYRTEAGEEPRNLEPWIQWVTVHTGLTYGQHKVFDLGDGAKLDAPRIWDLVSQEGGKNWICGSMNAQFQPGFQGFILPDPWSTGIQPFPTGEFEPFFNFVRSNVQEHTRESTASSKADQIHFLTYMVNHGMKLGTVKEIMLQLINERGGMNRWKRATILDSLQWDVFQSYWRRHRPRLATFFLNSTAHFQHSYWRNMEPDLFSVKPEKRDQADHADAIRFGYQHMDELVGKCFAMADEDTNIVLATALSQQPCLLYENTGGKSFYRLRDQNKFFAYLGIPNCRYAPVMSEQFVLYFDSESDASSAVAKLKGLHWNGSEVFLARQNGREVFAGCKLFEKLPSDSSIRGPKGDFPFYEHFYVCEVLKSGMHHPDGILWIRPAPTLDMQQGLRGELERVPLTTVAPTLLSLTGCSVPDFMEAPLNWMPYTHAV